MGKAPAVSFVVPCYNYGRYLPDCLGSIFAQEAGDDFEIVAIDDASTDDTQEVLRSFADPRLTVRLHERNQGHVVTVNEGFEMARGQFIARIDPDDRYRPYFLTRTLEKFRQFPEVALVYGDSALIDDAGRCTMDRCDRMHEGKDFKGKEFLRLLEENFICAPTTIGRRQAWAQVLPIPQGLAFNDWYFNLMLARRYEFYYIHEVLADYRVHGTNHHSRVIADKTEEPSIFRLLDGIFSEQEADASLEAAKRRAKGRVYSAQYVALANKYFGNQMNADARRCYGRAIRCAPKQLLNFGLLRRLAATYLGRARYEKGKSLVKSLMART